MPGPGSGLPTVAPPRPGWRAALARWLGRTTDAHFVVPAAAVVLLAMIWAATFHLVDVSRRSAELTAMRSIQELGETYEAQTTRALRELDQALNVVKYAYETAGRDVLADLKARELLPPELLFGVSITDADGRVVASTNTAPAPAPDPAALERHRGSVGLVVGRPFKPPDGDWQVLLSRRLDRPDGGYAGVVAISVDPAYFVSGYESSKLGLHGVLALLGDDGVFRARRSGDATVAGDRSDRAWLPPAGSESEAHALVLSPWDGVQRYTAVRRLYGFPLLVLVGLAADEQLAAAALEKRLALQRAAAASALLLAVAALFGRLAWQLRRSRQGELLALAVHAERSEHLAHHDSLTGLPNRSLFSRLLLQGIEGAKRNRERLALLYLDLDHFKQINDTLGHEAGDDLLQATARRMCDCLRASDTVARLGGDEFVAILHALPDDGHAATVARKILAAVAQPLTLAGEAVSISASVGISVYPQDGADEATLKRNADVAMYHAKLLGKNNFQYYAPQLNASALERVQLEAALRQALDRNEFRLEYRARRDIVDGRLTALEVLPAWHHPELGAVAPARFLAVAEECGLTLAIGRWMLRTACGQSVAWRRAGLAEMPLAVRLSARQLHDQSLPSELALILQTSGMDPRLLEVGITERLLLGDLERTLRAVRAFRDLGVRFAIDDFGVGYSSLAVLKQLPVDTVKVDRSLLDEAGALTNPQVIEAIIAMGRTLSLTVVAQGVRTQQQADFLRRNGGHQVQSADLDSPLSVEQATELLRRPGGAASTAPAPAPP